MAPQPSPFDPSEETADSTIDTLSSYASNLGAGPKSPSWWFPITELNERLPSWIHIGGQYRNRLEGPIGIGFTGTDDFYLLSRLRVRVLIQPKPWLSFHGEVQDARIFFNHHIANANPYEDSFTLWEAYPQLGNSTEGWGDVLAGRQVLYLETSASSAPPTGSTLAVLSTSRGSTFIILGTK